MENKKYKYLAKTLYGLEYLLEDELISLGVTETKVSNRAVLFNGSKEELYKANLHSRLALRILVPVLSFEAQDEEQLYSKIFNFKWSDYFSVDQTFAIDSVVHSKYFTHSKYASLKCKDAIVDRFRKDFQNRPNINVKSPDIRLNLHIDDANFSISLDSSGHSLHKRGYRLERTEAPLNEVLAAGMLILAGYDGSSILLDPMCGSGTIPIEAAMIATNTPPGIFKKDDFSFLNWKDFNQNIWQKILDDAESKIKKSTHKIYASDKSLKAIAIARKNIPRANVAEFIEMSIKPFAKVERESDSGILVMNPPYDERMKTEEITQLYSSIGDKLKSDFKNYTAWVLSSNKRAIKSVGLKPSKKIKLFNGKLECLFHSFELYEGSRKKRPE